MGMTIAISIAHRDGIFAAAAASADEICGLLLGRNGAVEEVRSCANVAADPARHFEIEPAALLAAHRAARQGGPDVLGHYHSHPTGVAEPSVADAAQAMADGAIWVIVGKGRMTAWRAVTNGALHGRFDPVAIIRTAACASDADSPQGGDI